MVAHRPAHALAKPIPRLSDSARQKTQAQLTERMGRALQSIVTIFEPCSRNPGLFNLMPLLSEGRHTLPGAREARRVIGGMEAVSSMKYGKGFDFPLELRPSVYDVRSGTAKQAAAKVGKADSSRAKAPPG